MKKLSIFLTTTTMVYLLTGCTDANNLIEKQITNRSAILENTDYQEYKRYEESGLLDSNGYYYEQTESSEKTEEKLVRVSFAKNSNLRIRYFGDSAHEVQIDEAQCFLNPGDSIYADISVSDDVTSNLYSFSGFQVYRYDSLEKRSKDYSVLINKTDNGYSLTIPASFNGTALSIEPVGKYVQRTLHLNDIYVDENDQPHELNGNWTINDKRCSSGIANISPVIPYIISYEYDSNKYFYVSSSPDSYYVNNSEGIVIFNQRNSTDETVDYDIELHKYMTKVLISDTSRSVSVNGGPTQTVNANSELAIGQLKYGDTVILQTNRKWPSLSRSKDLILTDSEELSNGEYRYKLIVPEKGGEFIFDPSQYSYAHGTISFKCFEQPVSSTQVLAKGSKIYYESVSSDPGYWLAGDSSEHYVIVDSKEKTEEALRSIHFTPKVSVRVILPQPSAGGTIVYKLNNEVISESICTTYSGATITMSFTPWQGWISCFAGDEYYTVEDTTSQTINIRGVRIEDIFSEDEEHKPELTVNLEKSVGTTMKIGINASGFDMSSNNYAGGWNLIDFFDGDISQYNLFTDAQTIVKEKKIGTDKPITISLSNRAIQAGSAVRILITLTDNKGNKSTETRYIDDLSKLIQPIYIYQEGTNANAKTWYKTVEITIGIVSIEKYEPPHSSPFSDVTLKNATTGATINKGDLIEGSQEVIVTITPKWGYYVTGRKVTNGIYSEQMKYIDYKKKISGIVSSHPVEKYIEIRLDKSDTYGSYSFSVDKEPIWGDVVFVKEGQTLKITYAIVNPDYTFVVNEDFLGNMVPYSHLVQAEKVISSGMDGTTLSKEDFGIRTERVSK